MKQKVLITVVLVLVSSLLLVNNSNGYQTADYFVFPISGYTDDGCLDWGVSVYRNGVLKRHVGDDYCVLAGTGVLAIGNGKVKYTWRDSGGSKGWYGLIITEHTLSNGNKVCSLYGHAEATEVSVGDEVIVGQKIGKIIEYPPSSNHIHFGIYNGSFGATEGTYPLWACGYVLPANYPGNYLDPVVFINSHLTPPNHSIIKFTNSPTCYLYSNSQLWSISTKATLASLGFSTYKCSSTADFDGLIELHPDQRGHFTIRDYDQIPSQGLVVKIVDKIGPNTCSARDSWRDQASIYMFDCYRFRPLASAQVYYDLCLAADWSDVVEITQDLFDKYGEEFMIFDPDHVWCGGFGGGGGDYEDCILAPYNLTAQAISTSQIRLQMSMSDICTNFEIRIYRDGQSIMKVPGHHGTNTIVVSGHAAGTNYCFQAQTVVVDNGVSYESNHSNTACTTTQKNQPAIPTANFTANPTSGDAPLAVSFTDSSTGAIDSYFWEFGNGQTSAIQNPEHIYNASGIFNIKLTVANSGGSSAKTMIITVQEQISPERPSPPTNVRIVD